MGRVKNRIRQAFEAAGYAIEKASPAPPPATTSRPIGDWEAFLEDVKQRGFHPSHIVDVGAHKAEWSRIARKVWPSASFTLIEPQAEMKPYLDDFAEQGRAKLILAGAGRQVGEAVLTIDADPYSSSFVYTEEEAARAGLSDRRIVPMVSLDSLLLEPNVPELVKIDVEGFELEVLGGASRFLGATELFILEVCFFPEGSRWPTALSVIQFMADHGYVPYDFCWFHRRPLDGALWLADIAFARDGGFLRSDRRYDGISA